MPLTGQAKVDYQRDYMRRRRSNTGSNGGSNSVRPKMASRIAAVRPSNGTEQDDMRAASERLTAALGGPAIVPIEPEPQSHNSMMVGYVPPTE